MCSLLTTVGVLLLVTAGNVTCADDFDFTCPDEWREGVVEQLVCTIPLNKLTSPTPCHTNTGIVDFNTKTGASATPACSANDPTCANTNVGVNQCGCKAKNATHITFVYKVNATKNVHNNIRWECAPQCLHSNLDPAITARNTSQCFQTKFPSTTTATPTTTGSTIQYTEDQPTKKNIGIGVGVFIAFLLCTGVVTAIVVHKTKILVFVILTEQQLKDLKALIKEMKGVSIRPTNKREKENNQEANYVIEIKLPFDRKNNKEKVDKLVKDQGACCCHKDDPNKTTSQSA